MDVQRTASCHLCTPSTAHSKHAERGDASPSALHADGLLSRALLLALRSAEDATPKSLSSTCLACAQPCLHASACDPALSPVRRIPMSASCMQQSGCRHHQGLLCPARLLQQIRELCKTPRLLSGCCSQIIASRATHHHQRLQVRALWLCTKNDRVQTRACLLRAQRTPYVKQPAAPQQRVHTLLQSCTQPPCSVSAPM